MEKKKKNPKQNKKHSIVTNIRLQLIGERTACTTSVFGAGFYSLHREAAKLRSAGSV